MLDAMLAAYDELPDGALVAGPDGEVVHLNVAGSRLLRLPAGPCLGRDFRDVLPLVDAAGRDWWACTDPYGGLHIRTGQPERLLELSDGPEKGRALLVTARYVRDGQKLARLVICFRGATSQERFDRERADLVSTVAHEIRSPLTGVKGFTATLLAKWDRFGEEQKRTMLTAINADADRVTRLLSDLLDVSRIDAGRLVLRRRVVDLPGVVAQVVAGFRAGGRLESQFAVHTEGPLPELWLDPDKVAQIVGNLVDNALRHGAGLVRIDVRPDPEMPGAVLTVSDEGDGIGPEARARIFTRFWRAAGAGSGTGLGLYIVKGLVEAHGGSIELDESVKGARFVVVLPAGRPPYEE
ncbi:MAG TPA: ATP-binding protein [Mycobacteriales bacterium]|nr:ATP-binding protein [Mycobacteriales bacterium]